MSAYNCVQLWYTVQQLNSSDNLHSYPLDNHHSSDDEFLMPSHSAVSNTLFIFSGFDSERGVIIVYLITNEFKQIRFIDV